jgi:DNA-binding GntR family transcriptional regulator
LSTTPVQFGTLIAEEELITFWIIAMDMPARVAVTPLEDDPLVPPEERMCREIYDAIMEHRLPAATKLSQEGLATSTGLRGTPGGKEACEMFKRRQMRETLVVRKLVDVSRQAGFAGLHALAGRERKAWMRGDRPHWIRLSAEVHIEPARLAGNSQRKTKQRHRKQ